MSSSGQDSEAAGTPHNGINSNSHKEDLAADGSDHVPDGDLFGDGSQDGEEGSAPYRRELDDEDLDSGDDEGRRDRLEDGYAHDDDEHGETREENVEDIRLPRHPIPRPSDGELYLFHMPNQLAIEPKPFHHSTFQPPTTDHHSDGPPSSTFSTYQAAISTARWRYSPKNTSHLQSNARVIRWDDGSLTVQLASKPREHYVLVAKALAPPQHKPLKPTPTSKKPSRSVRSVSPSSETYDAHLDAHTYLITPHESAQILRITNHITASLTVQSNSVEDDEAMIRLQERMAAAKANKASGGDGGMQVKTIREDPELAKMKAEAAEKEKIKAQRKRQQQEERERDRANRVLGRSGLSRTGGYGGAGAGLTVGGLEDEDSLGTTSRLPARPSKARKKPRRRNSDYSDDEDFRTRGRTKEDEYDEDDGFLVGSDEEPEIVDDGEDEEDFGSEDAEGEEVEERPKKPGAKREAADEGATGGRVKRRRVIEEDEDE